MVTMRSAELTRIFMPQVAAPGQVSRRCGHAAGCPAARVRADLGEAMIKFRRAEAAVRVGTAALAANRCKREIMLRCPPARRVVRRRYEARLAAHRSSLPGLDPCGRDIVFDLRRRGLAVTSLDELGLPCTDSLKESLTRFAGELASSSQAADGGGSVRLSRARLLADPSVLSWGLSSRLLDIVENYLELPPLYYDPLVSRDLAKTPPVGVRQWHRDAEDHRQVKIFIWIRDVEDRGGAYQYIPARFSEQITKALGYVSGFISDVEMDDIIPRNEWRRCQGPAWTVIFSDTARVFHRLGPDAVRDRYSSIFSYTSRHPLKRCVTDSVHAIDSELLKLCLDDRQFSCIDRQM